MYLDSQIGIKKSLLCFRTADFQFSRMFVLKLFSLSRVTASFGRVATASS